MPTIGFSGCLANYWFVWSVNGLGTIFGLAINMAVSYFFLKYFHSILKASSSAKSSSPAKGKSSTSKKPKSGSSNVRHKSPISKMPVGSSGNDT